MFSMGFLRPQNYFKGKQAKKRVREAKLEYLHYLSSLCPLAAAAPRHHLREL